MLLTVIASPRALRAQQLDPLTSALWRAAEVAEQGTTLEVAARFQRTNAPPLAPLGTGLGVRADLHRSLRTVGPLTLGVAGRANGVVGEAGISGLVLDGAANGRWTWGAIGGSAELGARWADHGDRAARARLAVGRIVHRRLMLGFTYELMTGSSVESTRSGPCTCSTDTLPGPDSLSPPSPSARSAAAARVAHSLGAHVGSTWLGLAWDVRGWQTLSAFSDSSVLRTTRSFQLATDVRRRITTSSEIVASAATGSYGRTLPGWRYSLGLRFRPADRFRSALDELRGEVCRAEAPAGTRAVRISVVHADAKSVVLAGDATRWRALAMRRRGDGDVWELELPLAPGVHRFRVRVDERPWVPLPGVPVETSEYGGVLGLVDVGDSLGACGVSAVGNPGRGRGD